MFESLKPSRPTRNHGFAYRAGWWIGRAIIAFLVLSVGLTVLYKFVPVPVTATMLMDPNGFTKDWTSLQSVMVGYANLGLNPAAASAPVETIDAAPTLAELPPELAETLARLIDNTLPALGNDDARVRVLTGLLPGALPASRSPRCR